MMDDFKLILDLLSAGGDTAVAFIAFAIWKLDRRVYRLELLTIGEKQNEKLA